MNPEPVQLHPPPHQPFPESIRLSPESIDIRLTPNEMRLLKQSTGKEMTDLMGEDADGADRMQAIAWVKLRRLGFQVPWEDAGDVLVEFVAEDPTNGESPKDSPGSAGSGG